jgi:hypothetical protein
LAEQWLHKDKLNNVGEYASEKIISLKSHVNNFDFQDCSFRHGEIKSIHYDFKVGTLEICIKLAFQRHIICRIIVSTKCGKLPELIVPAIQILLNFLARAGHGFPGGKRIVGTPITQEAKGIITSAQEVKATKRQCLIFFYLYPCRSS